MRNILSVVVLGAACIAACIGDASIRGVAAICIVAVWLIVKHI